MASYVDEVDLYMGDSLEVLAGLECDSVDSVVTDPPAGIGFGGLKWDSHKGYQGATKKGRLAQRSAKQMGLKAWEGGFLAFSVDWAVHALRVLKPGGHAVVWGMPRTSDLTMMALRVAGFEIRDVLQELTSKAPRMAQFVESLDDGQREAFVKAVEDPSHALHVYGGGMPHSRDLSKLLDRERDDHESVLKVTTWIKGAIARAGMTCASVDRAFGFKSMASHWASTKTQPTVPKPDQWVKLVGLLGVSPPTEIGELVKALNSRKGTPGEAFSMRPQGRQVKCGSSGLAHSDGMMAAMNKAGTYYESTGATQQSRSVEGWGTGVSPSSEPWILARKPLKGGRLRENVLENGLGGLNIDATRSPAGASEKYRKGSRRAEGVGRWPANTLVSHTDHCERIDHDWTCPEHCPAAVLDAQAAAYVQGAAVALPGDVLGGVTRSASPKPSRFFPQFRFQAKASKAERHLGCAGGGNAHPTVKPVGLMRWLIRLVTPKGGRCLDPFMGSGTTGVAAVLEGMAFVGVERVQASFETAELRIRHIHDRLRSEE